MQRPPGDEGYLLSGERSTAGATSTAVARHALLAEMFDPVTIRHLEHLGVAPGWRCWEVGAGASMVPAWLAKRVGPEGRVLATDLHPPLAGHGSGTAPEVRRHDIVGDDLPDETFDLVHARLLLVHLPGREEVVARLLRALAPGGWLLLEDADPALQPLACLDSTLPAAGLANRIRDGFRSLLAGRGADLAFGRTLPALLRGAGLEEVGAEAWFALAHPLSAALEAATVDLLRDRLVTEGVVSTEEVDRHLEAVARGEVDLVQPPLVSAWGRRAGAPGGIPRP